MVDPRSSAAPARGGQSWQRPTTGRPANETAPRTAAGAEKPSNPPANAQSPAPSGLEAFKSFKSEGARKTQQIAIQLHEYDLQAKQFVGARIDTGEVVRVELGPYKNRPDGKPRPEIEDFAKPRDKVHCAVGSVIQFDRAYEDSKRPGTFVANWANGLTEGPDRGYVLQGLARPLPVKEFNGRSAQTVQVLLPERAQLIDPKTLPLRDALVTALDKQEPGLPFAMIRGEAMIDGQLLVKTAMIYGQIEKDGDNFAMAPAEETVDKWLQEPFGRQVAQFATQVRTEVVPGTALRVGADTLAKLIDKEKTYDTEFRDRDKMLGFAPAFIAVAFKDDVPFIKHVARVETFGPVYRPEDAPTPFTQRATEPELPQDLDLGREDELMGHYDPHEPNF